MGGPYAIFWGSVCHIFSRNPLILTDFYAIQTPILWHIFGAYFLQIWGVGVVRIIFIKDRLTISFPLPFRWPLGFPSLIRRRPLQMGRLPGKLSGFNRKGRLKQEQTKRKGRMRWRNLTKDYMKT